MLLKRHVLPSVLTNELYFSLTFFGKTIASANINQQNFLHINPENKLTFFKGFELFIMKILQA